MTIRTELAIAIRHHQEGRPEVAESIYRQILAVEADNADAWHLLGVACAQQGKNQAGIECIRRALKLKPDSAQMHNNLGNALKELGQMDEAVARFRRAVELNPQFAGALENLGIALESQGNLKEALTCCRRLRDLNPQRPEAHLALGNKLRQQGMLAEAVDSYHTAVALKQDYAEAHNNLGTALHDQGKLDQAAACYRTALAIKADYAEAHNNLGLILREQEKFDEAVGCYRRALEVNPDYAEANNNLGILLSEQGKLEEAVVHCRRALEIKPGLVEAYNNLGVALAEQGKLDEAMACYRLALERKPDYAEAHTNLGLALKEQGKLEEAIACYRQVVRLETRSIPTGPEAQREFDLSRQSSRQVPSRRVEKQNRLGKALGQLAVLLQSRLPEDDLFAMRQLAYEPGLGDDGRAALHFGLAQAFDARSEYKAAAAHLDEANAPRLAALKKHKREYNPDKHRSFIRDMIATFTPEFFSHVLGFGLESKRPVFIVGLPRSGTTLVEQVLASHSQVFGGGELRYCEESFQSLPLIMHRMDSPLKCLLDLDRETTHRLAERHLERLTALNPKSALTVDKMPGNYQYLGLIRVLFPQARLIHCRRDFRDVALSCRMTNFASVAWACELDHIVFHFEEYARLMCHWRKVLPAPPLDVGYEEMVANTEATARRIIEWCGLEWEPACLRFYETKRLVRTASVAQVRRPIYKTSVGRWKNYEHLLSQLFTRVHQVEEAWFQHQPGTDPTSAESK